MILLKYSQISSPALSVQISVTLYEMVDLIVDVNLKKARCNIVDFKHMTHSPTQLIKIFKWSILCQYINISSPPFKVTTSDIADLIAKLI